MKNAKKANKTSLRFIGPAGRFQLNIERGSHPRGFFVELDLRLVGQMLGLHLAAIIKKKNGQ